jgi:hypothetical protein
VTSGLVGEDRDVRVAAVVTRMFPVGSFTAMPYGFASGVRRAAAFGACAAGSVGAYAAIFTVVVQGGRRRRDASRCWQFLRCGGAGEADRGALGRVPAETVTDSPTR